VNLYKPGKYIHEDELNQVQKRIEQLESELIKAKSGLSKLEASERLHDTIITCLQRVQKIEVDKLTEANRILREGLMFLRDNRIHDTRVTSHCAEALEQADKIMEEDEGLKCPDCEGKGPLEVKKLSMHRIKFKED
jgi:hypothetical protein